MSTTRQHGFILTFVIVLLALVAVVMFVLTEGANTMRFQADAAYAQAVDRNLAASGLAWAQLQIAEGEPALSEEPASLDVSSLADGRASLAVRITRGSSGTTRCHIETAVAKGRRSVDNSRETTLPAR